MKYKIADFLFKVFVLLTFPVALLWVIVYSLLAGVIWTWKKWYKVLKRSFRDAQSEKKND